MRGSLALRTEIFRCLDNAGSEIHLPIAIDGHTGGERMRGVDQPLGKTQAIVRGAGRQRGQHRGNAGRNLVALITVVATAEDEAVAGLLHLGHHHGGRDSPVKLVPALPHGSELGVGCAVSVGGVVCEVVVAQFLGLGLATALGFRGFFLFLVWVLFRVV